MNTNRPMAIRLMAIGLVMNVHLGLRQNQSAMARAKNNSVS